MNAFLALEIYIIVISLLFNKVHIKGTKEYKNSSKSTLYYVFCIVPLVFITGMRHNMNTDYVSYQYQFERYISQRTFKELLKDREFGFNVFQKIIGELSDYNIVFLMIVIALITCTSYVIFWEKYSENIGLNLVFLLVLGSYTTSFNTTRQFLAGALFLLAFKYIEERKLIYYVLVILLISTVHSSAIVMLPFYYLLNLNLKNRRKVLINYVVFIVGVIVFLRLEVIVNSFIRVFYDSYLNSALASSYDLSILTMIRGFFFIGFIVLNFKSIDLDCAADRIMLNALIYFEVFSMLAFKVYIAYRFTYYFLPLFLTLMSNVMCRNKRMKTINYTIIIVVMIMYIAFGQSQIDFKFYWQ